MRLLAVLFLLALALLEGQSSVFLSETRERNNETLAAALCQVADEEFFNTTGADRRIPIYAREPRSLNSNHYARQLEEKAQKSTLERIYQYELLLTKAMLDEGVSNLGDTTNLRRAMHKLVTGQPIKMVALGGSVTKGHGPLREENAYLPRIFAWINDTFPHPDHQLINHAIPAVTSTYFSPCVLSMVDEETDLVLVEFTYNDSTQTYIKQLEADTMRGLERLLRKLMRMPNQPGILYVHYWAGRVQRDNFADTVEDVVNTILKYYGLFGLSMRDSLHSVAFNETMMTQIFHQTWDLYHPTCIGSRFFADLVIGHLQDLAASELLEHHVAAGEGRAESLHKQLFERRGVQRALGPPLQKDNWGNLTDTCILEDHVQDLVRPGKGFNWMNEGKAGKSPKWGFVARNPGDNLTVEVPLEGVQTVNNELTVGLGFLVSYEHMGMAHVSCSSGCNCTGKDFSFLHPAWELNSITAWKPIDVVVLEGAHTCSLSVVVLNETKADPPEHKVKLTSVMLTAEKGFIQPCGAGDCP